MRTWALRRLRDAAGQYAASVAVVTVVAAFAVLLIETIDVLNRAEHAAGGDGGQAGIALGAVGFTFLGIAVLVAAIVVTNTFTTVYAGRLREIALLRLLGATSRQVRRTALLDGAVVGLVGAVLGLLAGVLLGLAGIAYLNGAVPGAGLAFGLPPALVIVPVVGGVGATTAAAFAAARGVSRTSPVDAVRVVASATRVGERSSIVRTVLGLGLVVVGGALLVGGALIGLLSPLGLLVAFPGGVLSIIGVVIGAPVVLTPVLRRAAVLLRHRAAPRLAGANLVLEPLRTARTTLAVTIGVALVTMFVEAGDLFLATARTRTAGAGDTAKVETVITALLVVVGVLTSFSILVAAIGVASTLSLSVLQRRSEIGMLRATGMTRRQVRAMLLVEGLLVTGIGVVAGLLLGVGYGYAGFLAVLGSVAQPLPVLPLAYVAIVVAGALAFGIVASLAPGRRASAVPPAEALRMP